MKHSDSLVDAVAKIIEPQLFVMADELKDDAYHRFVENTRARAAQIIAVIEKQRVRA